MANFSSETMEARRHEKTFSECWKKNNIVHEFYMQLNLSSIKKKKLRHLQEKKKHTKSLAGIFLRYIKVNLQGKMTVNSFSNTKR